MFWKSLIREQELRPYDFICSQISRRGRGGCRYRASRQGEHHPRRIDARPHAVPLQEQRTARPGRARVAVLEAVVATKGAVKAAVLPAGLAAGNAIPTTARALFAQRGAHIQVLDHRVADVDGELAALRKVNPVTRSRPEPLLPAATTGCGDVRILPADSIWASGKAPASRAGHMTAFDMRPVLRNPT